MLVGGIDSFIEPWLLDTLETAGRVRSSVNADGFSPAEGAAFLLLRASIAWKGLPPFGLSAKLRAGILLFAAIAILLFAERSVR